MQSTLSPIAAPIRFHFVRKSDNGKTGRIPTTMTEEKSCPETCPLKGNGCYAANSWTGKHWRRVASTGISLEALYKAIMALPAGQLWRHNVAGDLPEDTRPGAEKGEIDSQVLYAIAQANIGKRGFSYTHRELSARNITKLRTAAELGFTVNASANSAQEAARIVKTHALPTVTILPTDESRKSFDVDGVKIVTCPAVLRKDTTCATCGMCANAKRSFVIGFPAHGARAKKVDAIAKSGE